MSKSELCSESTSEIMSQFESIAQRSSSESGLEFKILSLVIDALMLWIVTSDELHFEMTGLTLDFSYVWLVPCVILYLSLSIIILGVKYSFQVYFIHKLKIYFRRARVQALRYPWCKLVSRFIYDIITIIMCVCFIAGDNLSDAICIDSALNGSCIERSSEPQKVDESCMAIVNISEDKEALPENNTGLNHCDVSMCRKASIGLLGISILLNLALIYCGHSFNSSLKGLPEIGRDHGLWTKAFNLLSLMLLFNQTLSGLHESIFKRTRNGTLCSNDTHISGGLVYGVSVALWVFFFIIHFYQYYVSKHKRKLCTASLYYMILVLILVLYCVFIFADTPWPWECFDTDPVMRIEGLALRSVLLTISVALILTLCITYIIVSYIPSLRMYLKKHIIVESEFERMFTNIAKEPDPIKVENANNLFVKSEVDETSSYTLFMMRDDDWISELFGSRCSNNTNTNDSNQHEQPVSEPAVVRDQMSTTEPPVGAYVKVGAGKDAKGSPRQSPLEYVAEAKYLEKQPQGDAGDLQQQDGIVTLDSFPKDSVISGFISKDITLNLPEVLQDGTVIRERKC